MAAFRGIRTLLALLFVASAGTAHADTWQHERYHLLMQRPGDWVAMSDALLMQANAKVSHLTGRGYIAGFVYHDANTLVFPYMLVQFKPYQALPADSRPTATLDERAHLDLLYALVGEFRKNGPLPATIDTPQFIDRHGTKHARLIRLDNDGRFDFTGVIPHAAGQTPIRYHTHGIAGRDGLALVSVFSVENFDSLDEVIQNEMRTIAFDEGFGMDALPTEAALKTDHDHASQNEPISNETTPPVVSGDSFDDQLDPEQRDPTEADPSEDVANPGNATAMFLILGIFGSLMFVIILVAGYVTHQRTKARRMRRIEHRERMLAAQSSARSKMQPRRTEPATAGSRGSSGRRKRGTSRS
ncbi:MAG: hypothetical protein ACPGYV_07470 [Phycisphaeraceae bacterium]